MKISDKLKLGDILQRTPNHYSSKHQGHERQGRTEKLHRLDEAKETINAMWNPGLDSVQVKHICENIGATWIRSAIYLIISYQYKFAGFDHCAMIIQDANLRGSWEKGIQELCTILMTFL